MHNLDTILKERGIKKTWFIKEIMKIPLGSFYSQSKTGRIPQAAIERAINHLGITFEEFSKKVCAQCGKSPVEQMGLCESCFLKYAEEMHDEYSGINESSP